MRSVVLPCKIVRGVDGRGRMKVFRAGNNSQLMWWAGRKIRSPLVLTGSARNPFRSNGPKRSGEFSLNIRVNGAAQCDIIINI